MFDLQAISAVAPIGDLVFGIVVICVAVLVANLAVLPKVASRNSQAAAVLFGVTALGIAATLTVLAVQPPSIFLVVLVYVVAFTLTGLAIAWRDVERFQATVRVVGGSACMLLALAVAQWVAHAPR